MKSHRVGRATLDTGGGTTAYRAVEGLECAHCGRTIAPGATFSRRARRLPACAIGMREITGGGTTEPICIDCRPLRLDSAGGDGD